MAKRILVVDDDMMCLKTVQRYLTEDGFEVLGALSGMQAIHIAEETKIDLLLLDIEMPGLNGYATLEQIRELPNGKQLPVIFFTGRKDRDTVKCCAAAGADGYITKPVEKRVLHERMEELFSRMSASREEQTVLIVDGDVELLKRFKLQLGKHFKVIVINSGKSAMDYLGNHRADVLVLDYALSMLDGVSIVDSVRKMDNGKDMPIIMLCDEEVATVKEACKANPANVYMKKPVHTEALMQSIQDQWINSAGK